RVPEVKPGAPGGGGKAARGQPIGQISGNEATAALTRRRWPSGSNWKRLGQRTRRVGVWRRETERKKAAKGLVSARRARVTARPRATEFCMAGAAREAHASPHLAIRIPPRVIGARADSRR